jgi:hypothetical protein
MTFVQCEDNDCRELADSLISTFRSLGWQNVEREYGQGGNTSPTRILIQDPKQETAATVANVIESATEGRLKANAQASDLKPLRIMIGAKPD